MLDGERSGDRPENEKPGRKRPYNGPAGLVKKQFRNNEVSQFSNSFIYLAFLINKKTMKHIVVLLMACFVLACNTSEASEPESKKPNKIIFLIGDGMGLSAVTTGF